MSLRHELEALFGKHTVIRSGLVDPSQVDAPSVQDAVGALLRLRGQPAEQMAYVRAMHPELAAAVCRWLSDPAFWGLVAGVTIQ